MSRPPGGWAPGPDPLADGSVVMQLVPALREKATGLDLTPEQAVDRFMEILYEPGGWRIIPPEEDRLLYLTAWQQAQRQAESVGAFLVVMDAATYRLQVRTAKGETRQLHLRLTAIAPGAQARKWPEDVPPLTRRDLGGFESLDELEPSTPPSPPGAQHGEKKHE